MPTDPRSADLRRPMEIKELAYLVREMRLTQAAYFVSRDMTVLREARALERRVDRAVAEVLSESGSGLFDAKRGDLPP